ncbi:xylosidase/arabinosidase, partial [human gut metagenome]
NAWPVVNGDGTIALQMDVPTLPQHPLAPKPARTDFKNGKLGPEWVHIRNYHPENYTFASGNLRLKATPVNLNNGKGSPTFAGRRQEHIDFTATTSMQLKKSRQWRRSRPDGLHVRIVPLRFISQAIGRRETSCSIALPIE